MQAMWMRALPMRVMRLLVLRMEGVQMQAVAVQGRWKQVSQRIGNTHRPLADTTVACLHQSGCNHADGGADVTIRMVAG